MDWISELVKRYKAAMIEQHEAYQVWKGSGEDEESALYGAYHRAVIELKAVEAEVRLHIADAGGGQGDG